MAVDQFMHLYDEGGTEIKGESRDAKHKESVDVLAWSWGMSNAANAHYGGGMGAGKVNAQDISFTKWIDKSSAPLQGACATGKHLQKAELIVRKAGDKPLEYLKYTLSDCLVTSVSTGGSGGEDRLTENVSLSFAKMKIEYFIQDATGKGTPAGQFVYSFAENEKQ